MLVHVVDIAQPGWEERMGAVNAIIGELGLRDPPVILAFNKIDAIDPQEASNLCRRWEAIGISAIDRYDRIPLARQDQRR